MDIVTGKAITIKTDININKVFTMNGLTKISLTLFPKKTILLRNPITLPPGKMFQFSFLGGYYISNKTHLPFFNIFYKFITLSFNSSKFKSPLIFRDYEP